MMCIAVAFLLARSLTPVTLRATAANQRTKGEGKGGNPLACATASHAYVMSPPDECINKKNLVQNWRNNSLGQSLQNSLTWEDMDKYAVPPPVTSRTINFGQVFFLNQFGSSWDWSPRQVDNLRWLELITAQEITVTISFLQAINHMLTDEKKSMMRFFIWHGLLYYLLKFIRL